VIFGEDRITFQAGSDKLAEGKMYIDILAMGLLAGLLKGGRLSNLGKMPLRGLGWFIFLGGLELVMVFTQSPERQLLYRWATMLAAVLVVGLLWMNRHLPGVRLVLLGAFLNIAVMAANGGRMPVLEWAAIASGQVAYLPELIDGTATRHVLLGTSTPLPILADIIPLPPPYPVPRVLSIGDLAIFAGVIRVVVWGMKVHERLHAH